MTQRARRRFLIGAATTLAAAATGGVWWQRRHRPAPIGFPVSTDELARARAFMAAHPVIDCHAHPGRTFVRGAEHVSGLVRLYVWRGTFERATIADMRAGGVSAAAFAAVSDFQTLAPSDGAGLASVRAFEPGEAWASYRRQIDNLNALVAQGLVQRIDRPGDVETARRAGRVGALLAVEGGDFLEGQPERVAQAYADGVRSMGLMHYRNNELGDIMTAPPRHGGLTAAGAAVVSAMNRCGMIVDLAHASEATAFGAMETSTRPVMASHAHVHHGEPNAPTRFISRGLATAIAAGGGGLVGAWPAGVGITDLNGFVDRTLELIDSVGIDHVCLGTDMDANYKPVLDSYANLPIYVAGLFQRGLTESEVARLVGGNFLRVFAAVQA
jgi:membrane dipeptidase